MFWRWLSCHLPSLFAQINTDDCALGALDIFVGDAPVVWIDDKTAAGEAFRQFLPEQQRGLECAVHVQRHIYLAIYVCLPPSVMDVVLVRVSGSIFAKSLAILPSNTTCTSSSSNGSFVCRNAPGMSTGEGCYGGRGFDLWHIQSLRPAISASSSFCGPVPLFLEVHEVL